MCNDIRERELSSAINVFLVIVKCNDNMKKEHLESKQFKETLNEQFKQFIYYSSLLNSFVITCYRCEREFNSLKRAVFKFDEFIQNAA